MSIRRWNMSFCRLRFRWWCPSDARPVDLRCSRFDETTRRARSTHWCGGKLPLVIDPSTIERLAAIVGRNRVLARDGELLTYASDGLPTYHKRPSVAVFPGSRDEVIAVVRLLAELELPFVPRGSGTGLSGGALADGIVLIGLHRLRNILSIDQHNCLAVVEPGVVNSTLTRAVAPYGLHYAPDPSSQTACTIGGNVAENAGGPHCLKYGVTTNHVVAITALLPDGTIHTLGGTT